MSSVPTSGQAAERLGWQLTKFNRKLDNVCDKLDRLGVRGLRGGPGKLASNRRARTDLHHRIRGHGSSQRRPPLRGAGGRASVRAGGSGGGVVFNVVLLFRAPS